MSTVTVVEKTDKSTSEEFAWKEAMKWASIGVGFIASNFYAMDKVRRYGEIVTKVDERHPLSGLAIIGDLRHTSYVVRGLTYAVLAINFFGPIYQAMLHGKSVKIFGGIITIPPENKILRVFVFYILLPVILVSVLLGVGINFSKLSKAYNKWERQLSYVANGLLCFWGILQVGLYLADVESYQNKRLSTFSNIATSLTAFFEMYEVDKILYSAEPEIGSVYWGVYGTRATLLRGDFIGLLISV